MKKLTPKSVQEYMLWRTDEEFRQCPKAVANACNELITKYANEFNDDKVSAQDLLKLLFFNDPIPHLHTHSYGYNTATGRHIIETLKIKYYEHKE